jgi:hypothetical protein
MTQKIDLLGMAVEKASLDRRFVAFLIKKYSEYENISQENVVLQLRCSEENYYKLCLCTAPDVEATDFLARLNNICEYAHVSALELNRIIKRANVILSFSKDEEQTRNFLMAARDKHIDDETER